MIVARKLVPLTRVSTVDLGSAASRAEQCEVTSFCVSGPRVAIMASTWG